MLKFKPVVDTFILFFLFFHSVSGSTSVSLDEIRQGVEEHYKGYHLCEFKYHVQYKNRQGKMESRRKTYRIQIPKEGRVAQCLIEESKGIGRDQIESFAVSDGKETLLYHRKKHRTRNWNEAIKIPLNDPEIFLEDSFARLLVTNIAGMPFTTLSQQEYDTIWKHTKEQFQLSGKRKLDGYHVLVFKKIIRDHEYEIQILEPPYSMIVAMKSTRLKDQKIRQDIRVQSIGTIGNFVYPQKGTVYEEAALTIDPDDQFQGVDYSFEVFSARRLDQFVPSEWIPAIPSGTILRDESTEEIKEIPQGIKNDFYTNITGGFQTRPEYSVERRFYFCSFSTNFFNRSETFSSARIS